MAQYWGLALAVNYLIAAVVITSVLRRRKEPMAMLLWIFAILSLPVLGSLLYGLVGSNRIRRKAGRRRRRIAHLITQFKHWAEQHAQAGETWTEAQLPEELAAIEQLGRRLSQMPATAGNAVRIYDEANATYAALEEAIRSARHHVHLEYYIWQPDETGRTFRDLLVEKARSGVQCRVLFDSVGCWRIGRRFTRPLLDAGAKVGFFLPLYPFRKRWSLHLRNHRKIAVMDGQVAFLGSQNIGDEYRGRLKRLSPWYDTHMRVDGPAALFVQQTFAEDWFFAAREDLGGDAYFPEPLRPGSSMVQLLPTGPDQDVRALEQLLFAAVSIARHSIRVETPYFVPDPGLRMALMHACYRGVRVQLILPTRSDSTLVLWAGRSFYAELLQAGVEIYEYDLGVLHSKIVTVDDRWCMLGSANMDVRSFRLSFEITALVYDEGVARELSASIERHCAHGRRITPRDAWQRHIGRQLIEGAARLFAPVL